MATMAIGTWRPRSAARLPVRELVRALMDGDDGEAMDVVHAMIARGRSRTSVFADLLHPAQVEVGNLWYRGEASYTDEVRVAAALRRVVCQLEPTPTRRPVRPGSSCIVAVPHDDPHDLGLLMLVRALQDHGWSTSTLCAAGPLHEIADLVRDRRPRLLCLSAGILPPLPQVERLIASVHRARIPVLVGGAAFARRPDVAGEVGADGLGTDVRVGVVLAHRLGGR